MGLQGRPAAGVIVIVAVILLLVFWSCRVVSSDFITWEDLRVGDDYLRGSSSAGSEWRRSGERVVVVSKDGRGDSVTVQGAVDMVPHGNTRRVKIFIFPGVYREKVFIPRTKPFVSLVGGNESTVISWHARASDRGFNGQSIGTLDSASVAVESDYFCAAWITFENTAPSALPGARGMQAVALRISGDKAVFHRCRILGSQDTLFDHIGRHFFSECFIQGSIDFIFGSARSLYKGCVLHAAAASYGAIAASQRSSEAEESGFSFLECKLTGSGMLYLGRAWGRYARVVYALCQMEGGIILPEGWSDWGDPSRRRTAWFGEYNCSGAGADLRKRVPWEKSLTYEAAKPFLDHNYIDGQDWLRL